MNIKHFIVLIFFLPFVAYADISSKKSCTSNADCVLVRAGCCDCNNGGKNEAINRQSEVDRSKEMKPKCEEMMCPTYISIDKSCAKSAIAVCKAGICEVSHDVKEEK